MTRIYLVIITFLLAVSGHTQSIRNLSGKVKDEKTKSAVKKLPIVITSLDSTSNFRATVKTDNQGAFVFPSVQAGHYELIVDDADYQYKKFKFEVTPEHRPNLNFNVNLNVSWLFNWGKTVRHVDEFGNVVTEHPTSHLFARIALGIYGLCLVLIFFYSVLQFSLSIAYARNRKKKSVEVYPVFNPATAPKVTVQLPMYNELYVAERIIQKASEFDYPLDKLEIQVLDDSTDETKDVIAKKVAEVAARGINIKHIHRTDRTGYKAGALDSAMDQVEGDFIAIFDADFEPEKDFLQKTMPYFENENIGVVQTRWGHINKSYSLLTELQAFGLNGHFAVEQGGRTASGHFINFNGTGGIWRKKCIEDAGGWEHDTLTEDLDLSYRAQLKGWKFKYCEHVVAPAELPITMSALKSQQHRWMKGGAECFRKMAWRIITFKGVRFTDRLHGVSHLFNSSVFMFILIMSLLSLVVLHIKDSFSDLNYIIQFGSIFIISTVFLVYYYWLAFRDKTENTFKSFIKFIGRFFQFLTVSLGLSLSNTVAVLEGYMGIKSSFVRTPKFNVLSKVEFKGNKYDKKSISLITIGEGLMMVVFAFTAINRASYGDLGMVPFHLMLAIGYGLVFFYSIRELRGNK